MYPIKHKGKSTAFFAAFALAAFSVLLASCFSAWQGDEGTFSISFGGDRAARTSLPWDSSVDIEELRHVIKLSGGPGQDQTKTIDPGVKKADFTVAPGEWLINIEASIGIKDGDETYWHDVRAVGEKKVTIKPGENGTISITMEEPKQEPDQINALQPEIVEITQDRTLEELGPFELFVNADSPDGGILSYQWYSNSDYSNTNGVLISGADSNEYVTNFEAEGTFYFYVIVTNTIEDNGDGGNKTACTISDPIEIIVLDTSPVKEDAFITICFQDFEDKAPGIEDIKIWRNSSDETNKPMSIIIEIEEPSQYKGGIFLFIDGDEIGGLNEELIKEGSITIYADDLIYGIGLHYLTIEVSTGSSWYSVTITFEIAIDE